MNLEGKQQIWNDYQKEIADDRYYYARSCIRQTFFPGSEWAYLDILIRFSPIRDTRLAQVSVIIPMSYRSRLS